MIESAQLPLPFQAIQARPLLQPRLSYEQKLVSLLAGDLSFHQQDSAYASHNFHAFPAKFPPQLPKAFIDVLTQPGDLVLDPMMGSGTTPLEAFIACRKAIGFDIDPLAVLVSTVKVTPLNSYLVSKTAHGLIQRARQLARQEGMTRPSWDDKTAEFIQYWFTEQTQQELTALITAIHELSDQRLRAFFLLAFSAVIITKSGGVSLARDLAHTRPHRAKVVYDASGCLLMGEALVQQRPARLEYMTKTIRPAIDEFEKRVQKNIASLKMLREDGQRPLLQFGNAQALPLPDGSIDLIVTSPPYASNAIDYMRAHKFSLVWFGYPIDQLGQQRRKYIGGEAIRAEDFVSLPDYTRQLVQEIAELDERKGDVLRRYYSEMTRTLREMYRVLKPGKAAVLVVGSSVLRGRDTETAVCLADIGRNLGFTVPPIGVRQLDRNRRMMPAGNNVNLNSQIQQRMHEEYVIGFIKPES
jgi:DNA modification methylase